MLCNDHLTNYHLTSYKIFFLVMRTFRIYSFSDFQIYYTAVLITVTVLYIQGQYKLTGGLCIQDHTYASS